MTLENGYVNWKLKKLDIAYKIVSGQPEWYITDYSEIKSYYDFELALSHGMLVILTSRGGGYMVSSVWDYDNTGNYKFQKLMVESSSSKSYLNCENFTLTKDDKVDYSLTKYELTTN